MNIRLQNAQRLLQEKELSCLIIDNPVDLYYLLGQDLSLGRLVIDKKGASLFVDGRYFEACRQLQDISVILTSGYGKESEFYNWWHFSGKRVGFDATATIYAVYEELTALDAEWVALRGPIQQLREIKDKDEIYKLKKAADLGSKGFDYLLSQLKEGVTEKELGLQLQLFWLKNGGEKLAFSPHVAFAESTSKPHYHSQDRKLQKGDLVLLDIGVVFDHYHSDMTRVVSFGTSQEMQKIYQIVYKAFHAACALCKPGVIIGDVDKAARDLIAKEGFKEHFPHGLGHGVGLEIHESPRIRSIGPDAHRALKEGMVITIEPGIYLPGKGGVRLEDTIVITQDGYENITKRLIPPELPIC